MQWSSKAAMEESYFSEFGPRENHDDDDDADADAGDDDDDEILDGFLCG
jgi:hypothetical protein